MTRPLGSLGQLLMIGLDEVSSSGSLERLLGRVVPGGVLLSPRHLAKPGCAAELLRKISLALPALPFLALEEEGGAVDPLGAIFPPLPSPEAAARKGVSAAARLGQLAGAALKLLGFNTNLAPLLEIPTATSNRFPGARAFGAAARDVARNAEAFSRGLERHAVLACAKYFPSRAGAESRGPERLVVNGKTMADLWREDLLPYRVLLPRLPLVLIGHTAHKAFDFAPPRPASLSENVVEGLLRVKLGYDGVAVADDLDAISRAADPGEAAVRAIGAGCDLLLVSGGEKSVHQALAGLKKGIETGALSGRRVERALARLRVARKGLSAPSGKVSDRGYRELCRELEALARECHPAEQKIA